MHTLRAKTVHLTLVGEQDAAFICTLRGNEELNRYLSATECSVDAQKQWIRNYKTREKNQEEYYFIIRRNQDQLPIGTVRAYDFQKNPPSFCWGSWILNEDKTQSAALESALLIYRFGFQELGFEQSHFDVRKGNQKVHSFHLKMGAEKIGEDADNIYYILTEKQNRANQNTYLKFLTES
ncbi:MAG: GNAT family N-acetyltransferase [Eikenella sp.]|nr:GNAT family N-acetyltransferase [Eikenella sp.]